MALTAITTVAQPIASSDVWRRCKRCGELKQLTNYLLMNKYRVIGSWRQCAACRARTPHAEWEKAS